MARHPLHDEERDPNPVVGDCPTCRGSGKVDGGKDAVGCPDCGGRGDIEAYDGGGDVCCND